jgi:hypothetical protein
MGFKRPQMLDTIIDRLRARVAYAAVYGVVLALELRGLALASAGQSDLTLPLPLKIAICAVFSWMCWEILWKVYQDGFRKAESALEGIVFSLLVAVICICFTVVQIASFVMQMYAGHGILEKPDYWEMGFYATLFLVFACGFDLGVRLFKRCPRRKLKWTDRIAALGISLLFASRFGMHFGSRHTRIVLKGVGCGALAIGMAAMSVGVLQAMLRKRAESH